MDLIEVNASNNFRHPWELSRCDSLLRILRKMGRNIQYADIGAGGLFFAKALSKITTRPVYAVDPYFKNNSSIKNIIFLKDFNEIPQKCLDFLLLMDVLEHVEDERALLSSLTDKLKHSGRILVEVESFVQPQAAGVYGGKVGMVLEGFDAGQNVPDLRLRLNRKDGGGAEIVAFPMMGFDGKAWIEHSNPAVDLAVTRLAISKKIQRYDVQMYTVDSATNDFFGTQAFIERFKIRPGDSAFKLGLVPYLFSKESENIVMTRSGTISMIGTKELSLPGGKQKAHFLDCPAFSGQSGGPAFVLLQRNEEGALIAGWQIALLGVVSEFVPSPLRAGEVQLTEEEKQRILIPIENTGISKVVPVDYLMDLLFSPGQLDFRKKIIKERKKSSNKP